jgi:hypothetical protein
MENVLEATKMLGVLVGVVLVAIAVAGGAALLFYWLYSFSFWLALGFVGLLILTFAWILLYLGVKGDV